MTANPYKECTLCPFACKADRTKGNAGRCGAGDKMRIARIAPHLWEEPCLSGQGIEFPVKGSGTVFFTGCSLHCVYCQNSAITRFAAAAGREYSETELAQSMLALQKTGVHNINLVTATHFLPSVIGAVSLAKSSGLQIPVVYNCSGYETEKSLSALNGIVDIFLPDVKYYSNRLAGLYSHASNYPEIAFKAVKLMQSITGSPVFDKNGFLLSGTIVRHLILPGSDRDSRKITDRLFSDFGKSGIVLSLMSQYTPMPGIPFPELTEHLPFSAYLRTVEHAQKLGFEYLYTQDGESASESFIPEFK